MKIQLSAKVENIEKQLTRIADALDLLLLKQFGYTTQEIIDRRPQRGSGEESIEYSTDEEMLKAEFKDLLEPLPEEEENLPPEGH